MAASPNSNERISWPTSFGGADPEGRRTSLHFGHTGGHAWRIPPRNERIPVACSTSSKSNVSTDDIARALKELDTDGSIAQ